MGLSMLRLIWRGPEIADRHLLDLEEAWEHRCVQQTEPSYLAPKVERFQTSLQHTGKAKIIAYFLKMNFFGHFFRTSWPHMYAHRGITNADVVREY